MRFLPKIAGLAALAVASAGCLGNPGSTGPYFNPANGQHTETNPTNCVTNATGLYEITVANTVVDGLCLTDGTLAIAASGVTVRNSEIHASPGTGFWGPVAILSGTGITVRNNIIDCEGDDAPENSGSTGVGSEVGTSATIVANEIRNCENGINLASNHTYSHNYIHLPDNSGDLHADGVQGSAEAEGGPGLHDILFEWNTIEFPLSSASFQFHGNSDPINGPGEGWQDVVVRKNAFRGGAYAVRLPAYTNGGIEFYGNRLASYPGEFGICTPKEPTNNTSVIDVWGLETGNTTDSLGRGIPDDANINEADDSVIERADCE